MDSKVLAKIYNVSTSLNESVETIDNNLAKILKIEVKEAKELKKERKEKEALRRRKEQLAKRKEKEVTNEKENKQIEEEKKGFGDILKGALGGLVTGLGGLLSGLGGIITSALGPLFSVVVGPAISAGVGAAFGFVGGVLKDIVVGLGKQVVKAIKPVAGLLKTGLLKLASSGLLAVAGKVVAMAAAPIAIAAGAGTIYNAASDNYYGGKDSSGNNLRNRLDARRSELKSKYGKGRNRSLSGAAAKEHKELTEAYEEIRELTIERDTRVREEATTVTYTGPKRNRRKTETVDEKKKQQILAEYDARIAALEKRLTEKYQFQTGGMVPTLLEPGEKVFTPGTWGPAIQQMNETFSRFQTGGIVQADHPDTGSGWSVGKDSQGRPSVFTKEAAEALAQAIRDSNGAVKTSDITSSKRSPDKNRAVGGVPNSNHLYGNAVDIHGTSKAWLKKNGPKYGWKNLVYSGHDGHFDFTKGATPIDEGNRERTADQEDTIMGGGEIDGGQTFENLRILGGVGGFIEGVMEGLAESGLGDIFGMLGGVGNAAGSVGGGILGLLGGVGGGVADMFSGGGSSVSSAPSPGGAFSEQALIAELDRRGIKNKNERAMFLAQMAHESGNFRYDEEIHDGSDYEGRSDLGNTQPGDGKRFKGRGYIQLTGRANYKTYGDKLGIDLVNNPDLAKDPNTAAAIAFEYWNARVNRAAAMKGDVRTVTKNINGGYNGLADRQSYFDKYSKQKLQQGGIVDIGGIGFGDKIPMNLPEGSFVLNRKASAILNGTLSGSPQAFIERMKEAQENYNSRVAEKGSGPVVIVQDEAPPNVVATPEPDQDVPNLPNGPSMIQAAEYFYHLSLGGNN